VFCDIKQQLMNPAILQMMAFSEYERSFTRACKRAQAYQADAAQQVYGWIENSAVLGVCGFLPHEGEVEITGIAVAAHARKRGIGRAMITALREMQGLPMEAETDDDAVGFYLKCGFAVEEAASKGGARRWVCNYPGTKSS